MSYVLETARLRFRPVTEADAPLFGEYFSKVFSNMGKHPVYDRAPYALVLCPCGTDTPCGSAVLDIVDNNDPKFYLRLNFADTTLFPANADKPDSRWVEAADAFIRFVPHRFGITEILLSPAEIPSESAARLAGFSKRDDVFARFCGWTAPKTPVLTEKSLRLVCKRLTPPDVMRGWVAVADYDIFVHHLRVGCCSLRLGYNETLFYGGQISYTVFPVYRGHGYAAAASRLLFDFAASCGFPMLSITCVPDNLASRRTAENAGFSLEGEFSIPKTLGMYAENRSIARRYVRRAE